MEFLTEAQQFLDSGSTAIYLAILALAFLEGFFLTTYLVNGTIGFVALGAVVAAGHLNAAATVACIYVGTLAGDAATYLLSARLHRVAFVAQYLEKLAKYRAPVVNSPFRFILMAHLTPYLKGASALLAGGSVPWRTWAPAEAVGALCGTLSFTGLGAAGVLVFRNARAFDTFAGPAGLVAFAVFIALWVRALRPCRVAGVCSVRRNPGGFGRNWKRLFFLFYFPLWHPIRWIESAARKLPSRSSVPDLATAFPDVIAGDIFLVRLHAPAPWGRWAHAAIAIDRFRFCHGFDKTISAHSFAEFPVRYTVAHLRVKCTAETAERAAAVAVEMIGRPVSIFAHPGETSRFSCTSLVCHAFGANGLDLAPKVAGRVTPDDLFYSPHVELIRTVSTEGAAVLGRQGVLSEQRPG